MMLLDGHQKSIILMINCPLVDKNTVEKLLVKILLHNQDLSGMKPLAIIMMRLLVSIMMEIQVYFHFMLKHHPRCIVCRPGLVKHTSLAYDI